MADLAINVHSSSNNGMSPSGYWCPGTMMSKPPQTPQSALSSMQSSLEVSVMFGHRSQVPGRKIKRGA
jgi:hypothetical protein